MNRRLPSPLPLLLAVLCLVLSACGGARSSVSTSFTPAEMVQTILDSQTGLPALYTMDQEDQDFSLYLEDYYRISSQAVKEGAIAYAGGVWASEVAVLVLQDGEDAAQVRQALLDYLDTRAAAFTGYVPDQAALAAQGQVAVQGDTVALLICPDPDGAWQAFLSCWEEGAVPPAAEPAGSAAPALSPEDGASLSPDSGGYDSQAVLQAWRGGDSSLLSEKDQAILERARAVLEELITPEMTSYEQELAIHDWMVLWGDYDPGALSHAAWEQSDPDNDNPYGFLVNGKGICLGYASTFQLFMDLLDIPCVTVEGAAYSGTEDHAWNMVYLEGDWYCVDVTWDDPSGLGTYITQYPQLAHQYFNVTSAYLRACDHQWDEQSTQEATGTALAWGGTWSPGLF